MDRVKAQKIKKSRSTTFRNALVVGTIALLLAVAYELFIDNRDRSLLNRVMQWNASEDIPAASAVVEESVVLDEALKAQVMLKGIEAIAPTELQSTIGEQERLDTIIKAFSHLPPEELERLEVDISKPVTAGTTEAEALFASWTRRQAELKELMKGMLNAAEHMGNLTRTLNGTAVDGSSSTQLSVDDQVYIIGQLESLLDDVDNARDYHTIGGWPTLLQMLTPTYSPEVRAAAAWAVGTAVKNTYDYQMWMLEAPSESSSSGVQLLVDMLAPVKQDEDVVLVQNMQRRAMYALSSAMRGNLDVQQAILAIRSDESDEILYLQRLFELAQVAKDGSGQTPIELVRKAWASLSDLLEERTFIRKELADAVNEQHQRQQLERESSENNNHTASPEMSAMQQELLSVQAMTLLGDYLLSPMWLTLAGQTGNQLAEHLLEVRNTGSDSTDTVAEHAALRSIMTFSLEALKSSPELYSDSSTASPLLLLVRIVTTSFDRTSGSFDSLLSYADELALLLGLHDQGANSAVA